MLGATKNQTVQYTILIFAFVLGLFAVGYTNGYSTVLPQLEYGGALISQLGSEFSEPFASLELLPVGRHDVLADRRHLRAAARARAILHG